MTRYLITKKKRVKDPKGYNYYNHGWTIRYAEWIVHACNVHDARVHSKFRYKTYELVSVRKVRN